MSQTMKNSKAITFIALPALLMLSACSGNSSEEPAAPSAASETTSEAPAVTNTPTAEQSTPVLSGGEQGGAQVPSSTVSAQMLSAVTEEDKAKALEAAKNIVTLYTAGGDHAEWFKNLAPNITAEQQSLLETFNPEPSKATVTGNAEVIADVKVQSDNPYWITAKVPTDKGDYAVRLVRQADRPDKWKADEILPLQVFESEQSE